MSEKGEASVLLGYVLNVLTCPKMTPGALGDLCNWFEESVDLMGFDPLDSRSIDMVEGLRDIRDADKHEVGAQLKGYLKEFLPDLKSHLRRLSRGAKSPLAGNLQVLQKEMGLDQNEFELFSLIVRYHGIKSVEDFCDTLTRSNVRPDFLISYLTGIPVNYVAKLVLKKSRLVNLGLVEAKSRIYSNYISDITIPDEVLKALYQSDGTIDSFRQSVLGPGAEPELLWEDFEHLQPTADRLAAFLKQARAKGLKGINILLHGPPGTGKTEFSKTLADHLGMSIFSVGETDDEGDEPNRRERLASLRLAQNLLRGQDDCLVLFDEMDDLFEASPFALFGGRSNSNSKIFGNRLLENNPVPTIWTINDTHLLDPANLRRMAFALEVKTPPQKSRVNVWKKILDKHEVVISAEELEEFASQDDVPPAVVENAVRFAKLSGGQAEDIRFAAEGIVRVMSGDRKRRKEEDVKEVFLPELANADLDLAFLTERLSVPDAARNFSLCLYGPSGTGKSAYARELADKLEMKVLFRRASDLLDMYVGNSEKNIARMFEQARDEEKFLILDEADSMLSERSGAQRSWEVTQVNEMLTWMERHPLPFVCTTNLMASLDQASLRRFTFKICFDYLTRKQTADAFRQFFNQPPPVDIDMLTHVTPGDFVTVRRKANILGCLEEPVRLTEMLEQEQQVKKVAKSLIGFS
jgi:SpoVK/Ycf46/Vps4 family AAA+-type ATPase